jgi:16S rRNA (cytosine1402-N4)-methyltransferase
MQKHIPVLLKEVISFFDNGTFIDCTFGAGGHSKALLEAGCKVFAIDRDALNDIFAMELSKEFPENFKFINQKFSNIDKIINDDFFQDKVINGILYDVGVSSMQIDNPERGFSFNKDAFLDMRMGINEKSAYDVVNFSSEKDLADIIYKYGDERFSRKIAKAIVKQRARKPIASTLELSSIVKSAIPFYNDKIDPSTRTFQAIRIAVNQELLELEQSLHKAIHLLPTNCKIAVITFHSLEDKIVKDIFNQYSRQTQPGYNRNDPRVFKESNNFDQRLKLLTKKPIIATKNEVLLNPRARSAKLRIAEKTA